MVHAPTHNVSLQACVFEKPLASYTSVHFDQNGLAVDTYDDHVHVDSCPMLMVVQLTSEVACMR